MTTKVLHGRTARILFPLAEVLIVIVSICYILISDVILLISWDVLVLCYLGVGGWLVWRDTDEPPRTGKAPSWRTTWAFPALASIAGANSAFIALVLKKDHAAGLDTTAVAAIASLGVALSWMLMQVGFAKIYRLLDQKRDALLFQNTPHPGMADYLYFSFTIGTAFATSDTMVTERRTRTVVTVHSIVAFFYNALVVAVAFQVIQQLVSGD